MQLYSGRNPISAPFAKNALFRINITQEPDLRFIRLFFKKLTEAFVYASKHFQPSSFNGFVSRSIDITVIFR